MVAVVTNNQIGDRFNLNNLQTIANPEQVLAMQAVAANIGVDQVVIDYAVRITRATRQWQGIRVGAYQVRQYCLNSWRREPMLY